MAASIAHHMPHGKANLQPIRRATRNRKRANPLAMSNVYDDGKRLREICAVILKEKFDGSMRRWATAAGLPESTVRKIIKGPTESPGLDVLTELAASSGYKVGQLIGELPLVPVEPPSEPADQALTRIAADFRRKAAGHSASVEQLIADLTALIATQKDRE